MARIPLHEIQKAVYERLVAASAGWSTSAGIYDYVPQNADYPFIELGTFTDENESTKDAVYGENTQELRVWSESKGAQEVNVILNQVVAALTDDVMLGSIDNNFRIFFVRREFVEVFKEQDDRGAIVRRGIVRIRFKVEDTLT